MSKEYQFLVAPLIFLFLSWYKYADTSSIQVDDNFFSTEFKILGNYILSLGAMLYSFYIFRKYFTNSIPFSNYFKLNILLAFICFLTLPMYSSDIFSILSFGTAEQFNSQIYTSYELKPTNIYYDYVYKLYRSVPCVYGPLNIWLSKLCQLSPHSVIINLFSIKFIYLILHFGFIFLIRFFSTRIHSEVFNLNYIRWIPLFPLVWFQGFMQLHNDILALFLAIVGAILLFTFHRLAASVFFLTLAFCIKFNFIFLFGIYFVYWFDLKNRIHRVKLSLGVIFSGIFLRVVYWPFIENWNDIFAPVFVISKMGTHGSLKDLLGLVGGIIDKNWLMEMYDIGLGILIFALFYLRKRSKISTSWFQGLMLLTVIVISLYAHRFFPWYLLLVMFFFYFKFPHSHEWWKWLTIISMAYCLQDLSVQIPHALRLFQLNVGMATILGFIAIFLFFRVRFLR